MKTIHHTSTTDENCPRCNRKFLMYWYDKEQLNGVGETRYGFDEVCYGCISKELGRPPKSLQELNEERA